MENELIMQYQKLIYSIMHYFEYYPNKDDLFQVGAIGLIQAHRRFDDTKGVKFSTYAYPYILGEMKKIIREDKGIKISREITKLNLQIERAKIILSQQYQREPSVDELAIYLDMEPWAIVEAMMSKNTLQSIDEPVTFDGSEMSLHETIADSKHQSMDELIDLRNQLNMLTREEKMLIEARYMDDMTQSEVSQMLGISQVQVSRKEQKIKVKLGARLMC